jgi:hypothetical protein
MGVVGKRTSWLISPLVIFGSCSQEGDATDVYFLHGFFNRRGRGLGDALAEWVQIADHDTNGMDGLSREIG